MYNEMRKSDTGENEMNAKLYQAIKNTVEEINEVDNGFYAECANRKLNALNENSSIESLVKTADDLVLISKKLGGE
jgi:hypothetical protein